MSDKEKEELQKEIIELESKISTMQETLDSIKDTLQNLKDIAWDRQSKKESSQMYKVLEDDKSSTRVKSNVGDVRVDKDFMKKQIQKHLDNKALRGMVTKEELLSFPKVAKNVEAEYNKLHKDYTWKVKANDGNVLRYGSREYNEQNRLITTYSETEKGQRNLGDNVGVGKQGQPYHFINDLNFLRPTKDSISQNKDENQTTYKQNEKEINRLITTHTKTEANERMAEEDRRGHPYHSIFKDFNFRKSANESILPQNKTKSQESLKQDSKRELPKTSALEHFSSKHKEHKQNIDSTKHIRRNRQ
ncbi:hypothetical protein [Helicobacter sp. MIT 14-3879]|uniref:hypothetical protein n=1 Tax=Helicobacter sp. MIT 14-3879 TaxID=2040649 RepID=UPI0021620ECF|nr:hypothetical protein [Helicobacter sp. MIT 14-3879]